MLTMTLCRVVVRGGCVFGYNRRHNVIVSISQSLAHVAVTRVSLKAVIQVLYLAGPVPPCVYIIMTFMTSTPIGSGGVLGYRVLVLSFEKLLQYFSCLTKLIAVVVSLVSPKSPGREVGQAAGGGHAGGGDHAARGGHDGARCHVLRLAAEGICLFRRVLCLTQGPLLTTSKC